MFAREHGLAVECLSWRNPRLDRRRRGTSAYLLWKANRNARRAFQATTVTAIRALNARVPRHQQIVAIALRWGDSQTPSPGRRANHRRMAGAVTKRTLIDLVVTVAEIAGWVPAQQKVTTGFLVHQQSGNISRARYVEDVCRFSLCGGSLLLYVTCCVDCLPKEGARIAVFLGRAH